MAPGTSRHIQSMYSRSLKNFWPTCHLKLFNSVLSLNLLACRAFIKLTARRCVQQFVGNVQNRAGFVSAQIPGCAELIFIERYTVAPTLRVSSIDQP